MNATYTCFVIHFRRTLKFLLSWSLTLIHVSKYILLFTLHRNYPDFYQKLYALFEPTVFHVKYKARFFFLADLFLSSTWVMFAIGTYISLILAVPNQQVGFIWHICLILSRIFNQLVVFVGWLQEVKQIIQKKTVFPYVSFHVFESVVIKW